MATLVAISYPDSATAFEARKAVSGMTKSYLVELIDAVVVTKDASGDVKLDQSMPIVEMGAANGALWGGLIGLIFLNPLLGAAVGAAGGALVGKGTDYGIDDQFMKGLGQSLTSGAGALFLLMNNPPSDKAMDELGRFGGSVLQTSLATDIEAKLRDAVEKGDITSVHRPTLTGEEI